MKSCFVKVWNKGGVLNGKGLDDPCLMGWGFDRLSRRSLFHTQDQDISMFVQQALFKETLAVGNLF